MKVNVGKLKEIQTATGPMIRFDLTIAADDGEPLWTSEGWRLDQFRKVRSPASRTKFGRMKSFHQISPRFEKMLQNALASFPAIEEILGVPKVEEMYTPLEQREELKGSRELATKKRWKHL